jgi:hypothetical protein
MPSPRMTQRAAMPPLRCRQFACPWMARRPSSLFARRALREHKRVRHRPTVASCIMFCSLGLGLVNNSAEQQESGFHDGKSDTLLGSCTLALIFKSLRT